MRVDIDVLRNDLNKALEKIVIKKKLCDDIMNDIEKRFLIPTGATAEFLFGMKSLEEANEFMMFALIDSICSIDSKIDISLSDYFTESEIKRYSATKFEDSKKWKRLELDAIQISNDQWSCVVDTEFFIKMRKMQKINYNTVTQRTMTCIVRGEETFYKPTVNKKEVRDIKESFDTGNYIPNVITLNIPADSEDDFWYNDDSHKLVIDKLDHFDILDGYHRYLAICAEKDSNPKFVYPMELRIVNFTENKAKQFIWQEDQKTQMKKIDSKSLNMGSSANIVVERLNDDISFNLKGCISRNDGQISFAELASIVDFIMFKGVSKTDLPKVRIEAIKLLRDGFNNLTEIDSNFLDKKYSYMDLVVLVTMFTEGIKAEDLSDVFVKTLYKIKQDEDMKKRLANGRTLSKPTIDKLIELISEVK